MQQIAVLIERGSIGKTEEYALSHFKQQQPEDYFK